LLACHYDHPNVAQLLLEKGASPHLASQNGQTPLHIAARKNQVRLKIYFDCCTNFSEIC
jgi:ankyrin